MSGPRVFGFRRWNREWFDHTVDSAADRAGVDGLDLAMRLIQLEPAQPTLGECRYKT